MTSEPMISVRAYVLVFVGLIVLTITTTGVAFIDLGAQWNAAAAIAIAVVKALLVILFFMHVWYSSPLTRVFVGIGFFWLAILFGLTLADYATRQQIRGAALSSQIEQSQGSPVPSMNDSQPSTR